MAVPLSEPCMMAAAKTEFDRMHRYAMSGEKRTVHRIITKMPAMG